MTASSPLIKIPPGGKNGIAAIAFCQVDAKQLPADTFAEAADIVFRDFLGDSLDDSTGDRQPPRLHDYKTVVVTTTQIRPDTKRQQDELTAAFDRCERHLAKVVDGYRVVAPRMIAPVRRETLPFIIPFAIHDLPPAAGAEISPGLFRIHEDVPHTPQPLDTDQLEKLRLMIGSTFYGHPFTVYSLRSKEAGAALTQRGDTADAVVRAQIASEVLLDALLLSMMWEEAVSPADAAVVFSDEGLSKRVRTHYASRLGGSWQFDGVSVVATWATNLQALRGRVVHGNYVPSRSEARSALSALNDLDSYVRMRLVSKRLRYKRTTLMLLGRPGLERLGGWSGRIIQFVEKEANKEPLWHAAFGDWRTRVNQARSPMSATLPP